MGNPSLFDRALDAAAGTVPLGPPGNPFNLGHAARLYNAFQEDDEGPSLPPKVPQRGGGGGGGGGGGKKQPNPIVQFIRSENPDLSRHDAKHLFNQFQAQQMNPGLAEFVQSKTNKPDPNTMQMFFAQTVAPYLKQTSQQFQGGAQAGTDAMQKILGGAAPSPAIDVLKQFLPLQQAGNQQLGAAYDAATVTAPYYDQLLSQLQENIAQQQRTQYYNQQLAAGVPAAAGGGEAAIDPKVAKALGL